MFRLLSFFNLNKFLLISLIIKPVGVTTKKNTIPITTGETNLPSKIPNLNHILFKGVKSFELIRPNTRNITETIKSQILTAWPFVKGHKNKIKKNKKKTTPKLLLDEILIFFVNIITLLWLVVGAYLLYLCQQL